MVAASGLRRHPQGGDVDGERTAGSGTPTVPRGPWEKVDAIHRTALSATEKSLLIEIAKMEARSRRKCFASHATMGRDITLAERTVRRDFRKLKEKSLLHIRPCPGRTCVVRINWPRVVAAGKTKQINLTPVRDAGVTPARDARGLARDTGGPVRDAGKGSYIGYEEENEGSRIPCLPSTIIEIASPTDPERALGESSWMTVKNCLAQRINRQTFATWFRPTHGLFLRNKILYVEVPNAVFAKWLGGDGQQLLLPVLNEQGAKLRIEYLPAHGFKFTGLPAPESDLGDQRRRHTEQVLEAGRRAGFWGVRIEEPKAR